MSINISLPKMCTIQSFLYTCFPKWVTEDQCHSLFMDSDVFPFIRDEYIEFPTNDPIRSVA